MCQGNCSNKMRAHRRTHFKMQKKAAIKLLSEIKIGTVRGFHGNGLCAEVFFQCTKRKGRRSAARTCRSRGMGRRCSSDLREGIGSPGVRLRVRARLPLDTYGRGECGRRRPQSTPPPSFTTEERGGLGPQNQPDLLPPPLEGGKGFKAAWSASWSLRTDRRSRLASVGSSRGAALTYGPQGRRSSFQRPFQNGGGPVPSKM